MDRKKQEVVQFRFAVGEGDLSDSDATDDHETEIVCIEFTLYLS